MSNPLDLNAIRELLPAYAIGAVEPDDARQIEAALAQHPDLRDELAGYQAVSDALLLAVPQIEPRPALRDAIMQRAEGGRNIRPLPPHRGLLYAMAAATIIVILLGVFFLTQDGELDEADRITAIVEDAAAIRIDFTGEDDFEAVQGAFIIAPDNQQAVLSVNNLDVLDDSRAYQLWLLRGEDQRISGLVFRPDQSDTMQLVTLPENFAEYVAFGVTIEPAGGSDAPTSSPVFVGELE